MVSHETNAFLGGLMWRQKALLLRYMQVAVWFVSNCLTIRTQAIWADLGVSWNPFYHLWYAKVHNTFSNLLGSNLLCKTKYSSIYFLKLP